MRRILTEGRIRRAIGGETVQEHKRGEIIGIHINDRGCGDQVAIGLEDQGGKDRGTSREGILDDNRRKAGIQHPVRGVAHQDSRRWTVAPEDGVSGHHQLAVRLERHGLGEGKAAEVGEQVPSVPKCVSSAPLGR
jgi:hypothetical protein